jgi:hypothetical protein
MKSWTKILGVFAMISVVGFLAWAYYPTVLTSGVPLAFKIEGAIDAKLNVRDVGASINQCAGIEALPVGKLWRASGFFSGWSCDRVGNPDVIYSLNYSDAENHRFYCRDNKGINIGRYFQHDELSDLEFLSTWETKKTMVRDACQFIVSALTELDSGKRVLLHCEAGRDRTGAVSALIAAWQIEEQGLLTDLQIQAIECDYRKSASLSMEKYGRIERLLKQIREQGGVRKFIGEHCKI